MDQVKKTDEQKRARSTETHREWRKNNPEKQQAIMDRFWAKKVAGMEKAHAVDLEKIRAEIAE